ERVVAEIAREGDRVRDRDRTDRGEHEQQRTAVDLVGHPARTLPRANSVLFRASSTRLVGFLGQSADAAALAQSGWWRAAGRIGAGDRGGQRSIATCTRSSYASRAR